jgi:hypothetical protein
MTSASRRRNQEQQPAERSSIPERDLERPLVDLVVLAYELVHAGVLKQAVSVFVDVHAV